VTLNRSGRSFGDEIRAFAAWANEGRQPTGRVRVVAYDYTRDGDWSFPDAPEVDEAGFEAILRSATRGWVSLLPRPGEPGTFVVAVEYFSDPEGRELVGDARVSVDWRDVARGNHPSRLETLGSAVLTAGRVPGPPAAPYEVGVAYPLAFDVCDGIAAVSFAARDVFPDIDRGWWCLVEQFWLSDGHWEPAGGSYDNTTTATPFERPTAIANSSVEWIDWVSNGGHAIWDQEPRERHSYFGIAPAHTTRLSVMTTDGRTRDVAITPWNGAWVVAATGVRSTLVGYDAAGAVLGTATLGTP
jgi:hypothetical protein